MRLKPSLAVAAAGIAALAACDAVSRGRGAKDGSAATPGGARRAANPPILAFDLHSEAMIDPGPLVAAGVAERAVLCFFPEALEKLARDGMLSLFEKIPGGDSGPLTVYVAERHGVRALVVHPGVGAPLAAARLEELIAAGAKTVVAVGGCRECECRDRPSVAMAPPSAIWRRGSPRSPPIGSSSASERRSTSAAGRTRWARPGPPTPSIGRPARS